MSSANNGRAAAVTCGIAAAAALWACTVSAAFGDTVREFDVQGPNPLGSRATSAALAPFEGSVAELEVLEEAAAALEARMRAHGHAFHRVRIPPQTIDDGVVRLEIDRFDIVRIETSGNHRYDDRRLRKILPRVNEGEAPNLRRLSRDVQLANRNPARRLNVAFAPEDDGVRARIDVQEERALRAFAWVNNSGSDQNGRTRVGAALQHANLLGLDHVASLSYTTAASDRDSLSQYALGYQIPFYRAASTLDVFALRSNTDAGTVAEFFEVRGRGDALGLRATYHLPVVGDYRHELALGVEDKLFVNDVRFVGEPIGADVRSRPLGVIYQGERSGDHVHLHARLAYHRNLSGGRDNDDDAYAATRIGADSDWQLWRFAIGADIALGRGWELRGRLSGQHTSEPLISGEQFGVGGVDSVRGVDERVLSDDRGWQAGAELWTPSLAGGLRLLAFTDHGALRRIDPLPEEIARDSLGTVGAGLRWQWRQSLSFRIDYGRVVRGSDADRAGAVEKGSDRVHANLLFRF